MFTIEFTKYHQKNNNMDHKVMFGVCETLRELADKKWNHISLTKNSGQLEPKGSN